MTRPSETTCHHAWIGANCPTCRAEQAAALATRDDGAIQDGAAALCRAIARIAKAHRVRSHEKHTADAVQGVAMLLEVISTGRVSVTQYRAAERAAAVPWLSADEKRLVGVAVATLSRELRDQMRAADNAEATR
jgi:hypothetical protein